jgi:hypothetical protein
MKKIKQLGIVKSLHTQYQSIAVTLYWDVGTVTDKVEEEHADFAGLARSRNERFVNLEVDLDEMVEVQEL